MANDMNRRGFLKYAAASALGMGALGVMTGCSSKETASSSAASTSGAVYTPGTYTASAEGYGSDVKASHPLSTPLGMSAYGGEDEFRLSASSRR